MKINSPTIEWPGIPFRIKNSKGNDYGIYNGNSEGACGESRP
jgi:hypothetical protein